MLRICDTLRRANAAEPFGSTARQLRRSNPRGEDRPHRIVPRLSRLKSRYSESLPILFRKEDAVNSSAFTAHTANASDGTALPDGSASRAVGATLNAARPARAMGS